jgi:hypothetical protein
MRGDLVHSRTLIAVRFKVAIQLPERSSERVITPVVNYRPKVLVFAIIGNGIGKAADWTGGSGFRFYRLGEAVFSEESKIKSRIGERRIGGQGWIRTSVRKTGQIYSLLPLTTRPPVHFSCGY